MSRYLQQDFDGDQTKKIQQILEEPEILQQKRHDQIQNQSIQSQQRSKSPNPKYSNISDQNLNVQRKSLPKQIDAYQVLLRFQNQRWTSFGSSGGGLGIETYLAVKHIHFKKYRYNIYFLQKSVLKIQHWFFKRLAQKQFVQFSSSKNQPVKIINESSFTMDEKRRDELMSIVKLQTEGQRNSSKSQDLRNSSNSARKQLLNSKSLYDQNQTSGRKQSSILQGHNASNQKEPGEFYLDEISDSGRDSTAEALRKVLEEKQMKKLEKTFPQTTPHKRSQSKYGDREKLKLLQSFEEKSYYKLVPTQNIKEQLTKAEQVFENYNREREYMSKSRSVSAGSHRASVNIQRDSSVSFQSPDIVAQVSTSDVFKQFDFHQSMGPDMSFHQDLTSTSKPVIQWETPSQQIENNGTQNQTQRNTQFNNKQVTRFQSPPAVLNDEGENKLRQSNAQLQNQKKLMTHKSPQKTKDIQNPQNDKATEQNEIIQTSNKKLDQVISQKSPTQVKEIKSNNLKQERVSISPTKSQNAVQQQNHQSYLQFKKQKDQQNLQKKPQILNPLPRNTSTSKDRGQYESNDLTPRENPPIPTPLLQNNTLQQSPQVQQSKVIVNTNPERSSIISQNQNKPQLLKRQLNKSVDFTNQKVSDVQSVKSQYAQLNQHSKFLNQEKPLQAE
eukprot:403335225